MTRLSHASGNVVLGELPGNEPAARFEHKGEFLDTEKGYMVPLPVEYRHLRMQAKLRQAMGTSEEE